MTGPLTTALLLAWIRTCALTYGVEPEFAQAVAIVESRPAGGGMEIRTGRLGKSRYYGPMGINRCFLNRWPIDDPYVNVEVGVKALRGADKRRVLRRYNPKLNRAYEQAVMATYRRLKGDGDR
jgi:hypothetical protein